MFLRSQAHAKDSEFAGMFFALPRMLELLLLLAAVGARGMGWKESAVFLQNQLAATSILDTFEKHNQTITTNVQEEGNGPGGPQQSLAHEPLQPCTEGTEEETGWKRTGSCVWDGSDSGYHQVCVQLSSQFVQQSKARDGSDLTQFEGQHWCICAWAFASAVARDPTNIEGLKLVCERTNARLCNVYAERGSGFMVGPNKKNQYPVNTALEKLKQICPGSCS
eukprot:gnl/MRDRNA2_/MRDRNA2_30445_c0_seq1.p1 gnl/MRDRNA2_/MRDRNA2_30445_c0~~gnl/MRDRNA2_/MRDRNA2_30445_c0_seq1.p1  ORF type:complete len:222 (-),score=35.82 gnl/MRDRNA2_/MRDRNA2_30445_c0_seq1:121-786(-)